VVAAVRADVKAVAEAAAIDIEALLHALFEFLCVGSRAIFGRVRDFSIATMLKGGISGIADFSVENGFQCAHGFFSL
jgi:hypothetical protein